MPNATATAEHIDVEDMPLSTSNNVPAVAGNSQQPVFNVPQFSVPAQQQALTGGFANIAKAIASVMADIGVVAEGGENKFQNYKYMSYKDLYRKLTPLMGRAGLAVIPSEKHKNIFDNDTAVMATYQFTIIHSSGEIWPHSPEWTGMSRARDSKGGFDDKALNKCATAAQKYFLKALFQIPSGEDDEDADHHDGHVDQAPKPRQRAAVPSPTAAEEKPAAPPTPAEPSELATIEGEGMKAWAARYVAAIQTAKTEADLNQWDARNNTTLDLIYEKARDTVFADIQAAFEKRRLELVMAAEAAPAGRPKPGAKTETKPDPITSGPQTRDLGYPDPRIDYEGFLKHCEAGIAAAKTPDLLNEFVETTINQHFEDLMPPDSAELTGLADKAMRRFE